MEYLINRLKPQAIVVSQKNCLFNLYYLKGTSSVISSDPHKALSDQVWYKTILEIYAFVFENCLFWFVFSLQKWLANFLVIRRTGEIIRTKDVSS